MKSWLSFIFFTIVSIAGHSHDRILQRIIFIGDVTSKGAEQKNILQHAMANVVGGKTSVIYSDENSYLHGKASPEVNGPDPLSKFGSRSISQ